MTHQWLTSRVNCDPVLQLHTVSALLIHFPQQSLGTLKSTAPPSDAAQRGARASTWGLAAMMV